MASRNAGMTFCSAQLLSEDNIFGSNGVHVAVIQRISFVHGIAVQLSRGCWRNVWRRQSEYSFEHDVDMWPSWSIL